MPFLILYLAIGLVFGVLTQSVTRSKSRSVAAGFWLGFLFGPLGMVIAGLLMPDYHARDEAAELHSMKQCPDCAELVKREARKCRHCGLEFGSAADPDAGAFDRQVSARRMFAPEVR